MTIQLLNFGSVISDHLIGEKILKDIKQTLSNNEICVIDFKDVISMATFNAKQIFGKLYLELGSEKFFTQIEIQNASNDLKLIIRLGIQSAVEDNALTT